MVGIRNNQGIFIKENSLGLYKGNLLLNCI